MNSKPKTLRIMVDILHPAHVHFFHHFIKRMQEEGHEIMVTTRNKEMTMELLDQLAIPYVQISAVKKGAIGRVRELTSRSLKFYRLAKQFKPDLIISEQGPTTAPVGKVIRVPSLIFWDTEVSKLTNAVCYPLATAVYTPVSYQGKVRGNHIRYHGYQKLAYLHPHQFKADPEVVKQYKLPARFCLLRFVSLTSNHDAGAQGIVNKKQFVEALNAKIPVFISSEEKIPTDLQQYQLKIKVKDFHQVLAAASLYVGESATIATEAAILGVPSIYVANSERGYINELQDKYQLVCWCKDEKSALSKALELVSDSETAKLWKKRQHKMLKEVVDLTEYMVQEVKKWVSGAQHA